MLVLSCLDYTNKHSYVTIVVKRVNSNLTLYIEVCLLASSVCVNLLLRLSVIDVLIIPPFTIFSNLKNGNLSDFSKQSIPTNYHSLD